MWDIFKCGIILMLYCLASGALLAFVYIKTAPVIEAQKEAAAVESVIEVLPGMDGGFDKKETEDDFIYWIGYRDKGKKTPDGYTFIARQKGYSSTIESMVGVDADFIITGVKVLFQQETAGIGDRILEIRDGESEPWFTRQFIGKTMTDDIKISKDGGTIDAISGATVSSRAVSLSIDNGRKMMKAALTGETFVSEEMPEEEDDEIVFVDFTAVTAVEALEIVLPDMAGEYELNDEDSEFTYWTAYISAAKIEIGGYLFVASGEGYSSTIETIVGVDTEGKIIGIKIISQEETEEWGDGIVGIRMGEDDPWFTRQFLGKSASDTIALVEDDGDIDAVTEATVSSRAVTEPVNDGLKKLMEIIQ